MNFTPLSRARFTAAVALAAGLAVPVLAAQEGPVVRPLARPVIRPVPPVVSQAAQGASSTQTFRRTFPFPSGGIFSLANVNGSIEVEGWEREEVELVAIQKKASDVPGTPGVRIEVTAGPAALAVRTIYPEGAGEDVSVEYRIRVPRRVRLAGVATVNGTVRVRGVEGEGQLRTVNGNVEMYDGVGRFDARSTNGNIYMELRGFGAADSRQARPAAMETVNGTIVLALPAGVDSDIDVHTLNGDFSSELAFERTVSAGGRAIRGRMGAGGNPLRIRTMNGAVRLLIARAIV